MLTSDSDVELRRVAGESSSLGAQFGCACHTLRGAHHPSVASVQDVKWRAPKGAPIQLECLPVQPGGPPSDSPVACSANKMREHSARFAPTNSGNGAPGSSANTNG